MLLTVTPVRVLKEEELSTSPKVNNTVLLKIQNSLKIQFTQIQKLMVELSYGIEVITD
jgi:hypothetical protein